MMWTLRTALFLVIPLGAEAYRVRRTDTDLGDLQLEELHGEKTLAKTENELEDEMAMALEHQWNERRFVELNAIASPASRSLWMNGNVARRRRTRRGGSIFDGGAPPCPDKPECVEALSSGELTCEGPELKFGDFINESHAQFLCPTACATPYERSHCIRSTTGCQVANACIGGWRPVTNCSEPRECKTDTDVDPWCPSATDPSETFPCDKCMESLASASEADLWEPVATKLRCLEVAVTAGDASGPKFEFENRGTKLTEARMSGSMGKWPATVALVTAVRDGHLDWDTLASDVFSWWTSDPADARSRVSFRHLLNFASGFHIADNGEGNMHWTHHGWQQRCLTAPYANLYTPESCAQQIYETATFVGEPGTVADYNSYHLQIALAMAVERSGMGALELLQKNLFEPAGMTDSSWSGGENPVMAYGISTSGADYGRFMRAYLANELLPKEYTDIMETDYWNSPGVSLEHNSMEELIRGWAMGNMVKTEQSGPFQGKHNCMGGIGISCISREHGSYFVVWPPTSDYFIPGMPISWAYHWIVNDVDIAISASQGNA